METGLGGNEAKEVPSPHPKDLPHEPPSIESTDAQPIGFHTMLAIQTLHRTHAVVLDTQYLYWRLEHCALEFEEPRNNTRPHGYIGFPGSNSCILLEVIVTEGNSTHQERG